MSLRPRNEAQARVERSTYVFGCAVVTYLILIGFGLLGMVPLWVWVVALPLHFIAGMAFEQEKCREDGPIDF